MSDWNPCASAPRLWFAPPPLCGCGCSFGVGYEVQTRSVFMRAYPACWMDYLPDEGSLRFFRTQSGSLAFDSNQGPYHGSGSWTAEESFNGTYDEWGNLSIDGTWSEEWHDSFFSPPSDPRNHYVSSTTVDADGCLSGSESGYKDTPSLRTRYDCPTGAGCTYHGPTTSKTNIDESDSCTPTSGGGPTWNFERHLALTSEINSSDLIATIDSLLPALSSLPWGAGQSGVVRRFKPESDCAYPGAWEDPSVLGDELAALEAAASSAATELASYESALAAAESALSDYLGEWATKHEQWRTESVSRCNGEGTLSEEDWAELKSFLYGRISAQESFQHDIATAKLNVDDATTYKAVCDFHVAQKIAQQGSYTPGKFAGYMEAGGGLEVSDETAWPAWVDKGHAQARVRINLDYPSPGETFEVKIGALHTFTVAIVAGEYFGFSGAYTYDDAAQSAEITVTNITHS